MIFGPFDLPTASADLLWAIADESEETAWN